MFASMRGIDLVRWFTPDDEDEAAMAKTSDDLLITKEVFTRKLEGLGLGLGAGQDKETQTEISNAISRGSIDTCCRKNNCDADSPHLSGAPRISIKTLLKVAKVDFNLEAKAAKVAPPPPPPPPSVPFPPRPAAAARRSGGAPSPPRQRRSPAAAAAAVSVPPVKPTKPLAIAQKPLWSPSNVHTSIKGGKKAFVEGNSPQKQDNDVDLQKEIEACIRGLVRQSDSYQKLKHGLDLDKRCETETETGNLEGNCAISANALKTTLQSLGLTLGPAGLTALMRTICSTSPSDSATPTHISPTVLRDYFLKLKLKKEIKWSEWMEKKTTTQQKEKQYQQGQFENALKGERFNLPEDLYNSMIRSFRIVDPTDMEKEVKALAEEWIKSTDGGRTARRKAIELATGQGALSKEDKEAISQRARQFAVQEHRKSLNEEESSNQKVSRELFREYVSLNKRNNFANTKPFSEWMKDRENKRARTRQMRAEWTNAKDDEARRIAKAGKKVATMADVSALVRKLTDAAVAESKDKGITQSHPTRQGLEIARKLREIERLAGEGKIVNKATFDKVMKDVMFSLMADKKTAAQAKKLAKSYVRLGADDDLELSVSMGQMEKEVNLDGVFKADDAESVAKYALQQKEKKRDECKQGYKDWLKKKRIAARKEKKAIKKAEKEKIAAKEVRQKQAETAYDDWKKLHSGKKYFSYKHKTELDLPKKRKARQKNDWLDLSLDNEEDTNDENAAKN